MSKLAHYKGTPFLARAATNVRSDSYRPAFRQSAPAPDSRVDQTLRQLSRQRSHRYRYLAAAHPCPARRERRWQIDAGQNHLRIDPAERGRDALAGGEEGFFRA